MLSAPVEIARRASTRLTGRIRTLPILALSVHSACNCRCVMCDIWKANAAKKEISLDALERHVEAIRRLHVQRVMLTGGEPLLHSNLWAFCRRLRQEGVHLTLVTTGLLIEPHAAQIADLIDEVVISVDGPPAVHDAIRRVAGGFERIAKGLRALRAAGPALTLRQAQGHPERSRGVSERNQRRRVEGGPSLIVRCVLQKANYRSLEEAIYETRALGVDRLSFLAADVSSRAFNRAEPWPENRRAEIALSSDDVPAFAAAIARAEQACDDAFTSGFVQGGVSSLWRIRDYYAALAGLRDWPRVRCNAPWVSAVLEPDGLVRPCFFHDAYGTANGRALETVLNSPQAIQFRRTLDVRRDETCRRCVCSLSLPLTGRV